MPDTRFPLPLRRRLAPLFCALLLLAAGPARAATPEKDAEIMVHSEPEGATVMVLGKTWGETPMRLRLKDAFPALYRPEQPYIGMAVYLRKDGCSEFRYPIHRRSVPEEIHAELDCEPEVTEAAATTAPAAGAAAAAIPAAKPATPAAAPPARRPTFTVDTPVRKKLQELEELRKEGLISEPEYQQLRKRVLEYF